tara:strand:+ start:452 stop:736 length:285 start_codon:yes stop_codon:yes gene_type:complete
LCTLAISEPENSIDSSRTGDLPGLKNFPYTEALEAPWGEARAQPSNLGKSSAVVEKQKKSNKLPTEIRFCLSNQFIFTRIFLFCCYASGTSKNK